MANAEPAAGSAASPPDRDRVWTAEIEWRAIERGARFCVIARADDGTGELTISHSSPVNWPPGRGESVQALTDAADELEAALLAAGWKPLPPGSAWYAKRFVSEPSAEAAPSAQLGPAGTAPPVWVQTVGLKLSEEEPADPVPVIWSPPVPAWPPPGQSRPLEGGVEAGDVETEEGEAGAGLPLLPLDPDAMVSVVSERSVVRRTLPVAVVVLLVGASAVAGLLLARALRDGDTAPAVPPAATLLTITHDGLRLGVPSGWTPGEAEQVPGFSRPLSLRNEGERLSAVIERLPATSASLLPLAFETALPTARERREGVRFTSGQPAWRYRIAQADGSTTAFYAAPTTSGVATVACMGPAGGGVPRGCDALANAITVPGSLPLGLGTSAAFYSRLPAALRQLEAARSTGTRQLSVAKSAAAQAAAADGLVRAHKDAYAALAPLAAAGAGLPARLAGGLNRVAGAYGALAGAARARSSQRYDAAVRGVADADAGLRRTLSQAAAAANVASRAATGGEAP